MCQRPVDRALRLNFGGAPTDFCLSGLPTAPQGEGPSPTSVGIDGTDNFVGNFAILHRSRDT
jgi:hypothetical protein